MKYLPAGMSRSIAPHGRIYLVNATGTHPLGNTDFAETTWRAASQPQSGPPELTTSPP